MIIIKYCNIHSLQDQELQYYLNLLPDFMISEILKYKYLADQKSRLLARLMLRESLIETNAIDVLPNWKRSFSYKPEIGSWKAFNIAHSSELVVFTYTDADSIGIDIEKKDDIVYHDIMKYFHKKEQLFILDSNDSIDSFYSIWTRKEAALKAIGIGIVGGLSDFDCTSDIIRYNESELYLRDLIIHTEYKCSICVPKVENSIIIQKFEIKSDLSLEN